MESNGSLRTPVVVVIISGKRKSGKDYVAELLKQKLFHAFATGSAVTGTSQVSDAGDSTIPSVEVNIIHVAEPIKREWARRYQLNLEQLMDSSAVKEKYRRDMVAWGNEQRARDPDIFCRLATESLINPTRGKDEQSLPAIWILADARQESDVNHFVGRFSRSRCITVRVVADEATRTKRGWRFVDGIDDAVTECGLDAFTDWDFIVSNKESSPQEDGKSLDAQAELIVKQTLASMRSA